MYNISNNSSLSYREFSSNLPITKPSQKSNGRIYPRELPRFNATAFELNLEKDGLSYYQKTLAQNLVPECLKGSCIYNERKTRKFRSLNCFESEITFPYLDPNIIRPILPNTPTRTLDAPGLLDDFYFTVMDLNDLALAVLLDGTVYVKPNLTDASTIEEIEEPPVGTIESAVAWDLHSKLQMGVKTSCSSTLWSYDIEAKKGVFIPTFEGPYQTTIIRSLDENVILLGSKSGHLCAVDTRVQRAIYRKPPDDQAVSSIATKSNDLTFATGNNENIVAFWDFKKTDAPVFSYAHEACIKGLAFNPMHPHILSSGGGTTDKQIILVNTSTQEIKITYDTGSQICGLTWDQEGKKLVANLGFGSNGIQVFNYNHNSSELTRIQEILSAHTDRILHCANSKPLKTYYVTGSPDNYVHLWEVSNIYKKAKKASSNSLNFPTIR